MLATALPFVRLKDHSLAPPTPCSARIEIVLQISRQFCRFLRKLGCTLLGIDPSPDVLGIVAHGPANADAGYITALGKRPQCAFADAEGGGRLPARPEQPQGLSGVDRVHASPLTPYAVYPVVSSTY